MCAKRWKVKHNPEICPKCHVNFKVKVPNVLWKDVVECGKCGHMWVLIDHEVFLSFCGQ